MDLMCLFVAHPVGAVRVPAIGRGSAEPAPHGLDAVGGTDDADDAGNEQEAHLSVGNQCQCVHRRRRYILHETSNINHQPTATTRSSPIVAIIDRRMSVIH